MEVVDIIPGTLGLHPVYSSDPRHNVGLQALRKFRQDLHGQITRQTSFTSYIALQKSDDKAEELVICCLVDDPMKIRLPYDSVNGVRIIVSSILQ